MLHEASKASIRACCLWAKLAWGAESEEGMKQGNRCSAGFLRVSPPHSDCVARRQAANDTFTHTRAEGLLSHDT